MAISKRLRFEVLKRDGHRCRYCGGSAPDVVLTVDHVVPQALGGSDDPSNLVAACQDCNGGKTSSSPDAPLVAQVAEDALRWAQAMQAAATEMLAQRGDLTDAHRRFAGWWDQWTYGEQELPIPKDPGWQQSVDALLAAGLPMSLLEECVRIAMSRKRVTPENTFRYMCGVAWNKVTELQESARKILTGDAPAAGPVRDPYDQGRGDFARELLSELSDEERAYYLDQADMSDYQDEGDEPQTETQLACDAISSALNSVRCDWDYLARRVEETLHALPGDIGERALAPREDKLAELAGPYGRRTFRLTDALAIADDLLGLPAAREYLNTMTDAERAEWRAFAAALYERANLDEDRLTSRAGHCAQVIAEGHYWNDMCIGHGDAIPACPKRGTNYARIDGAKCCGPERAPDHKGHRVCDRHLEDLIAGTFVAQDGTPLSATDYVAVGSDPWDF